MINQNFMILFDWGFIENMRVILYLLLSGYAIKL
jgi:hypothetical protein